MNFDEKTITGKLVSEDEVRIVDGTLEAYFGKDEDIRLPEGIQTIKHCDSSGIRTVIIPEGVTEIDNYAFAGSERLEKVSLPSTLTRIGSDAFKNCSSLTSIIIPDGVKEIGDGAFAGCHNLSEIKLPKNCNSIPPSAFLGCELLKSIECESQEIVLDDNTLSGFDIEDGVLYSYAGKEKDVIVPDCVKEIAEEAFVDCNEITSIKLPKSVESIGYAAFQWCQNLTSITIENSEISIDDNVFDGCFSLAIVNKPDEIDDDYFMETPWYGNK